MKIIPLGRYSYRVLHLLAFILICHVIHIYRLGEGDDCSGAVAFLCSDDASYITGETIVMAGGTQSRL